MEAGIADTINREDARRIAEHLDLYDIDLCPTEHGPWYLTTAADVMLKTDDFTGSDRAWLTGVFAAATPGLYFDGNPADCDWENLYEHLRVQIRARRDLESPSVCAAETPRGMV